MKRYYLFGIPLLLVCAVVGAVLADYYRESPSELHPRFVGRQSCAECHQSQVDLFEGSDHDLAMDLANESTVLANFDNQTLDHYGITSRMFREGDKFMVHTEGPDGKMQDFEVKYVFGVRPLQQYMVELERPEDAKANEVGRVQVLRLSWDTQRKRWFYLTPPDVDEKLSPTDPLHWTGITQNWNASCASCHSTDVHKNFNAISGQYHTTFSEIDVSCEACHGPGEYHIKLAKRNSLFWDRQHGYGLLAKLKVEDNVPQVEACAPCHARRTQLTESFPHGGCNFDDYFATQLVADPIYHVDGQIRDEDYVYGSFIQSKMYHNGVKCSDCHDPHSAKVKFTDNQLCTSCHQHPAGKYDTPNHHHHAPGTPGSNCVDCHMPETTYMMVDGRRDHSFRVPRPDLSLRMGTPNACTQCHLNPDNVTERTSDLPLNQYLDWIIAAENGDQVVAAELKRVNTWMKQATDSWYSGDTSAEQSRYYEQLAAGLSGTAGDESAPTLIRISRDLKNPDMIRASALAGLVEHEHPESLETALAALEDSSPKVIAAALLRIDAEIGRVLNRQRYSQSPDAFSGQLKQIASAIASLLSHDSLRVRTEAARVFTGLDPQTQSTATSPRQRKDYEAAFEELKRSLRVENDRASTHMMLGGLHEMRGELDLAKSCYQTAVATEPNIAGPRSNLAALLDAEREQLQANMRAIQSGQSGGMQAGQLKQLLERMRALAIRSESLRKEEHDLLAEDIRRSEGLVNTHGLHYRYAMSCYLQGELEKTEYHLLKAHNDAPDNATYLLGLATYYLQTRATDAARPFVNKLLEQDPSNPGYQALDRSLKQQTQGGGVK